MQKLVYLSKYFGWDNPFIFTLAERGPYSVELKQIYSMSNLFDNLPEKINGFNLSAIRDFIIHKNLLFIEASATILYQFRGNISEDECVASIHSLKNYISPDTISDAYNSIGNFKLYFDNFIDEEKVNSLQFEVTDKINMLNNKFNEYEDSRNQIIVLGTIDYMRITLRESNLDLADKYNLLIFIKRYLTLVDRISNEITHSSFINLNLNNLEELFEQFQEFVSEELHIIKKIDDEEFDQSLFY